MSLTILNNISSLNAENSISLTQANLQKTLIQLSSGLRVNSGSDDAAGLSIANGLNANISALSQSSQNATNTTGLLQTADGALSQVTSLLNRAVTLATEASSNGLSASQTAALNTEFTSVLNSINNIGANTNFNGKDVFTTNAVTPFLSDGTSGNNLLGTTAVKVGALTTSGLSLGTGLATSATPASNTLTLTTNPASGSVTVGTQTYTFTSGALSAGKVAIGSDAAHTLTNLAAAIAGDSNNTANATATAVATGNSIVISAKATGTAGNGTVATTSALVAPGGGATGTWGNSSHLTGGTDLSTSKWELGNSSPINPNDTVNVGNKTYTFVSSLTATPNEVLIGGTVLATYQNLVKAVNGDVSGSGSAYSSTTTANAFVTANPATSSAYFNSYVDFVAKDPGSIGEADMGAKIATGNNDGWVQMTAGTDATPATDSLTLTSNLANNSSVTIAGQAYTFTTGTVGANQVAIGVDAATTLGNLAAAIGGDSHNTANASVTASSGGTTTLTITAKTPGSAGNSTTISSSLTATGGGGATGTWSGGTSTGGGANASSGTTNLDTPANAQAALVAVTNAINTISQSRGSLGAFINQLTAASNVMTSQIQNLQSANNGLVNADIGKTVANMTQYNVLQSTGMSALQQANQAQQAVLKLLQ